MVLEKIYLDTSVFIADFDKKSPEHKILIKVLKKIGNVENTEFCYSKWALTEMNNKLTKRQIEELKIIKYIKEILDVNKLKCLKLKFVDVSPNKNYNFNDFFNDLSKDLIKYKTGRDRPGLGDIIHVRIMKNNRIKTLLTFDSHFENIQGLTTINLRKLNLEGNAENEHSNNSKK